jgi:diguanylate cyclase (GGDEF)-like protein/PAS domain S-box-containing protein
VRRTGKELESLWEKLAHLKRLESDLLATGSPAPAGTADQIKAEIEGRLGYFPPFFAPAAGSSALLESLWRQQLFSYYDNPLPEIFKEKLSAWLSRRCASPYFIVVHSCMLHQLGMTALEVRQWLDKPALARAGDIERAQAIMAKVSHPLEAWPKENSNFEESLIIYCSAVFLGSSQAGRCAAELRDVLGSAYYANLVALLASIKSAHLWIETHPDVSYEQHPIVQRNLPVLVQDEPSLAEIFRNHRELRGDLASKAAAAEEDRYRELFENAGDIIYAHDFEGNLLSINRAVERIAGYDRSEALQMKITDFIAPEFSQLGLKMTDPQISGEIPLNYELEIISKEKTRVTLEISTRPVFRGGRAVAVQGIARDVTKRKKIESELQEANQKLEAWVGELERRTREMTLLSDMSDVLRACVTTEEAYNVIVRVAQQIFQVKVGALYVIAPSRNLVEAAAVWGDATLAEHAFSPQGCWALRRGRTHCIEDSSSGLICRHVRHPSPEGYVCVPMMAQSEALGVLHLMQPDNVKMTEAKQRMAITFSEHVAMALSNLKLHETLRSQSIRDPLTGLFNRRFMEESLELEIRRAARNQRPLGMIMIDLDNFKYFNDNFGHDAGDLLLKELGTLLKGSIRAEDIACRYGGEEFTLILPEGTGAVTRQRAEFFRQAIQHLDVQYRGHSIGKMTASMGVAIFPDHGRTAKALIEAADKALYSSKSAGRDRVTLAG